MSSRAWTSKSCFILGCVCDTQTRPICPKNSKISPFVLLGGFQCPFVPRVSEERRHGLFTEPVSSLHNGAAGDRSVAALRQAQMGHHRLDATLPQKRHSDDEPDDRLCWQSPPSDRLHLDYLECFLNDTLWQVLRQRSHGHGSLRQHPLQLGFE